MKRVIQHTHPDIAKTVQRLNVAFKPNLSIAQPVARATPYFACGLSLLILSFPFPFVLLSPLSSPLGLGTRLLN